MRKGTGAWLKSPRAQEPKDVEIHAQSTEFQALFILDLAWHDAAKNTQYSRSSWSCLHSSAILEVLASSAISEVPRPSETLEDLRPPFGKHSKWQKVNLGWVRRACLERHGPGAWILHSSRFHNMSAS